MYENIGDRIMEKYIIPSVSIIMPAYNAASTIEDSINSVLIQTYQYWELIIVDDASTDNTADIVNAYVSKDSRIFLYTNKTNKGAAATRNMGIQRAKGEFIAFLDSDDLWSKDKLKKQLNLMIEKNAAISFTGTSYINIAGQISKYILKAKEYLSYKELLRRNIMSCSSVMVRQDSMILFPEGYMHEDYAVWLQIVKKTKQAYGLDEPLLIYRMGEKSKSSNRLNSAIMNHNAYRHVGYGRLASLLLMLRYAKHSIFKRYMIKSRTIAEQKTNSP